MQHSHRASILDASKVAVFEHHPNLIITTLIKGNTQSSGPLYPPTRAVLWCHRSSLHCCRSKKHRLFSTTEPSFVCPYAMLSVGDSLRDQSLAHVKGSYEKSRKGLDLLDQHLRFCTKTRNIFWNLQRTRVAGEKWYLVL